MSAHTAEMVSVIHHQHSIWIKAQSIMRTFCFVCKQPNNPIHMLSAVNVKTCFIQFVLAIKVHKTLQIYHLGHVLPVALLLQHQTLHTLENIKKTLCFDNEKEACPKKTSFSLTKELSTI